MVISGAGVGITIKVFQFASTHSRAYVVLGEMMKRTVAKTLALNIFIRCIKTIEDDTNEVDTYSLSLQGGTPKVFLFYQLRQGLYPLCNIPVLCVLQVRLS